MNIEFSTTAWLACLLVLCAIALLFFSSKKQRQIGFPDGRVVYQDVEEHIEPDRPLFDPQNRLTGKPDYLVRQGSQLIPVEVKSTLSGDLPYDSHIYQLMAYCLLVQSNYQQRPSYGILHYPQRTIAIDFTVEREISLINLIREMQTRRNYIELPRSHQSSRRCAACGYRRLCDQRM